MIRRSWCCRWLLPSSRLWCLRLRLYRNSELEFRRGTFARSHDAWCLGGQIRGHRLSFGLVLAWNAACRLAIISAVSSWVALSLRAFAALLPFRLTLRRSSFGATRGKTFGERVRPAAIAANMNELGVRRASLPVHLPAFAGSLIIELACVFTGVLLLRWCFRCFWCPYRSRSRCPLWGLRLLT